MYTVTVKDKTFSANFELVAKRDDYIHALVVWFAVDFSKCHRNIRLSTCKAAFPWSVKPPLT